MDEPVASAEVMRAIGVMADQVPDSWSAPGYWAHIVQEVASLIVDLEPHLDQVQLAVLMSIGAMAHRQSEIEQAAEVRHG